MGARAAITGDLSKNEVARIKFMEYFNNFVKRKENIIENIQSFNQIVKATGVRPNYNVGEGAYFMPSDMILTGESEICQIQDKQDSFYQIRRDWIE